MKVMRNKFFEIFHLNKRIMFIFCVLSVFLFFYYFPIFANSKTHNLGVLHFSYHDRVLVVAPHPDDESLACAGIIRYSVEHKIPVLVVVMNSGDGYKKNVELHFKTFNPTPEDFQKLGYIRHSESIDAMKKLGLDEKNIIFLGYPDGGTNSLFDTNWDCDNLHKGANGSTYAPYSFAYENNAPYCGENVVKNLEEIIKNFNPTIIFYPDPGDNHHDHWATGAFAKYVLTKTRYKSKQFTYLVHKGFDWPFPWAYSPKRYLLPPSNLIGLDIKWLKFPISKSEENFKFKAVQSYTSQKFMMEPFLEAFVRQNELFAVYPDIKTKPVKKMPSFFEGKVLPCRIFRDPQKDTLIADLDGYGDLTSIGFTMNKDNAWIIIETRRGISQNIIYGIHLRIFGVNSISRADIKIQGGQAYSEIWAKNSMKFDGIIPMEIKNKRLALQLPAIIFKDDVKYFMLNVDVVNGQKQRRIDRTAWRVISLSK